MFKTQFHKPLTVYYFFNTYQASLDLRIIKAKDLIKKVIKVAEVERPGLTLAGYLKDHSYNRMLLFGKLELEYLQDLHENIRLERLKGILSKKIPVIVMSAGLEAPLELKQLCEEYGIPLLASQQETMHLFNNLTGILAEEFAPSVSCHGTLVEAFGVGLLIQGNSSVGKSEAALGLIERGHRLISDDVVRIKKRKGGRLEGTGPELTKHLLEIRGIGIINVANIYGAVCVSDSQVIDLIVKLEEWDDNHFYDRVGLEEKYCDILGVKVLYHILPVKPGRDVVLLLETIVLNHRLKEMGYNSAKEFNVKLLETIAKRTKGQQAIETYSGS
jgi:HPr kinase/phosphorylase